MKHIKIKKKSTAAIWLVRLGALIFWLAVWQIAAMKVDADVLLPAPFTVMCRLAELIPTEAFIRSVAASVGRIMTGYLTAALFGTLLAVIISRSRILDALFSPILGVITATPVASFIILALVWIGRDTVPTFICFLIVLPVMASHVGAGIRSVDPSLREMCTSYEFSPHRKLFLLYLPSAMPQVTAGLATSLGLAWKSGVAAEVLCVPKNSIGKHVYESKLYLETTDLFAWTVTVILASMLIECVLRALIGRISSKSKESANPPHIDSDISESSITEYAELPIASESRMRLDSDRITIDNISKSFGDNTVLNGFSLELPAHKITAITGPSGSGKTTLLRIISGLESADNGKVIGAVPVDCATVFQEPRLLPWLSAAENVACVSPSYKLTDKASALSEAEAVLAALGLSDIACKAKPYELSGGMCQRVSLARAMISRRPLLLLDEPFRGLDAALKERVMTFVKNGADTVLLSTHSPEEAEFMGAELVRIDATSSRNISEK